MELLVIRLSDTKGYKDGYKDGISDWIAARRSDYCIACRTDSPHTYHGQHGRGYSDGWNYAAREIKQLSN